MAAFLQTIEEKFGGVETYVIGQCGLTKEEIEKIRAHLIIQSPGPERIL